MPLQRTVFRTPLIRSILRIAASLTLRMLGWRVVGAPPTAKKFVLCAAPHTSNWDFPLMLMVMLKLRMDVHWMGKNDLFRFPCGGLMRWLGGIPIDRSRNSNTVAQMIEIYASAEELAVLIPPEGTRAHVQRWKTGFYHIAYGAGVPIQLGFFDARTRSAGFGPLIYPNGNIDAELPSIQAFFADKEGLRPVARTNETSDPVGSDAVLPPAAEVERSASGARDQRG